WRTRWRGAISWRYCPKGIERSGWYWGAKRPRTGCEGGLGGGTKENAPNRSGRFQQAFKASLALPALEHQGGVGATEAEAVAHDGVDLGVFLGLAQDRH